MSRHIKCVLLTLAALLSGCATTASRRSAPAPVTKLVDRQTYELDERSSCVTGEPLLQRQKFLTTATLVGVKPNQQFTISGGLGPASATVSGTPQTIFRYYGVVSGQRAYAIPNHPHSYVFGINDEGAFTGVVGGVTYGYSPVVGMNQYRIQPPETRFEEVVTSRQQALSDGSYIHHEIMFSGCTNTELRLLYREYTPTGMAREAFQQDLVFPADAQSIRVKQYRIMIHSVGAGGLEFEVKSDA